MRNLDNIAVVGVHRPPQLLRVLVGADLHRLPDGKAVGFCGADGDAEDGEHERCDETLDLHFCSEGFVILRRSLFYADYSNGDCRWECAANWLHI